MEISPFEEAMFTVLIRHEEALRGLVNPSWEEKVRVLEAARRRLNEIKRVSEALLASREDQPGQSGPIEPTK
ncbi:MAG: hypothetical protein U0529_08935 [Thermoanaerobaculia bacterium]